MPTNTGLARVRRRLSGDDAKSRLIDILREKSERITHHLGAALTSQYRQGVGLQVKMIIHPELPVSFEFMTLHGFPESQAQNAPEWMPATRFKYLKPTQLSGAVDVVRLSDSLQSFLGEDFHGAAEQVGKNSAGGVFTQYLEVWVGPRPAMMLPDEPAAPLVEEPAPAKAPPKGSPPPPGPKPPRPAPQLSYPPERLHQTYEEVFRERVSLFAEFFDQVFHDHPFTEKAVILEWTLMLMAEGSSHSPPNFATALTAFPIDPSAHFLRTHLFHESQQLAYGPDPTLWISPVHCGTYREVLEARLFDDISRDHLLGVPRPANFIRRYYSIRLGESWAWHADETAATTQEIFSIHANLEQPIRDYVPILLSEHPFTRKNVVLEIIFDAGVKNPKNIQDLIRIQTFKNENGQLIPGEFWRDPVESPRHLRRMLERIVRDTFEKALEYHYEPNRYRFTIELTKKAQTQLRVDLA